MKKFWAIEDARTEAKEPLVIGMRNGESVLGYIYMLRENGKPVLHLAPWDMDSAFFYGYFTNPEDFRFVLNLHAVVRMLDLNVQDCREMLHSMYQRKCETILSDQAIDEWALSLEQDIGIASAYLRESQKWYGEACHLILSDLIVHQMEQVALTKRFIQERWPIESSIIKRRSPFRLRLLLHKFWNAPFS